MKIPALVVILSTCLAATLAAPAARASAEVDLLIARLVEKGLLTEADAQALAEEMRALRPGVPTRELSAAPALMQPAPSEVPPLTIKGDLRVRYQTDSLDGTAGEPSLDLEAEDRMRIRWRLGADVRVTDGWQVGFGLSSGGTDPRSGNATLDDAFSRADARLDYAYARYAASESLEVLAGKFRNPVWAPADLLWDTDIRPDGGAARYSTALSEQIDVFLTPAYLELSRSVDGGTDEARMWLVQAGARIEATDRVAVTLAPAYYQFANLEGTDGPLTVDVPSNTRDGGGNLLYDYDAVGFGLDVAIADVGPLTALELYGEYVDALDAPDDDTGYLLGIAIGHPEVAGWADWRLYYNYRRLERDAWPEFLTDSDAFFGATNVKGGEVQFDFGLARNVWLSIDYYANARYIGTDVEQDLLQVDLNLRW